MAYLDIGIDLGTTTIIANDAGRNIVVTEPALVAVDRRTDKVISIGTEVYQMIGRTPTYIEVVKPLQDGVISDYKMTEVLIRHLLQKMCSNQLIKPRLIVCVPSGITGVESQSVIDSALAAGARSVHLVEEPVAAAIGAGLNLALPNGNLIVDIGGGTCDIAVLSLNGIVCKSSLRVAGQKFDDALMKYMRSSYNLLVGEKIAEQVKIKIGSVDPEAPDMEVDIKGRDLISGLPKKIRIRRSELYPIFAEVADTIVRAVQNVLERTPPELVGDIYTNGLVLTGGGAMLGGLDRMLEKGTRVRARLADNAMECVAIGTARSFAYLGKLYDGLVETKNRIH